MERYERKIRIKKNILYVLLFLSFVIIIVIGELGRLNILLDGRNVPVLAETTQKIIAFGWLIYLVFQIKKCSNIIKNPMLLEERCLEEHDERKKYIDGKVGNLGFQLLINCLFITTFFASFINIQVFYTLLDILLLSISIKYLLIWYFDMKF